MNKIFEQLLAVRHLDKNFLNPRYENLTDPFILPDMEKGVARLKSAITNNQKILIYGDYDVDGVTASTVMEQTLILAGIKPENIEIMLPDRFADGYGMSPKMLSRAKKDKINLVITVDCGSRNHEIVSELNSNGIDSIITDHHETADTLPDALAVINPKRKDFKNQNGLRDLAGVGVAFKFAQALVKEGIIKNGQEKWLLDLVLIGTMCDNMPITNENRILGFYGFKVLAKTRRQGLKALMHSANTKTLNSDSIGFQLGPRLNAAGRLKTADLSLNLLRTNSSAESANLATKLEELNQQRRIEQQTAVKEIEQRGVSSDPVIIESGKWHEGIVGIVAGRLVEKYHRPAFVLSECENDNLKGSGRSFGDFSLAEALANLKDPRISGGGHAGAAGVRLPKSALPDFRQKINDYYRSLHLIDQQDYLLAHPDLDVDDFSDFNLEFMQLLKLLEPFGAGNEEPIFRLKNIRISEVQTMGTEQQHLRLTLLDQSGHRLKVVAFNAPEKWLKLSQDDQIEPIIKLTENEWNCIRSVEARLIDVNMI